MFKCDSPVNALNCALLGQYLTTHRLKGTFLYDKGKKKVKVTLFPFGMMVQMKERYEFRGENKCTYIYKEFENWCRNE